MTTVSKQGKNILKSKSKPVYRNLTAAEKGKGRSVGYWDMSASDQWAEDRRLGILDWDGK
jgi:hypothetical protein